MKDFVKVVLSLGVAAMSLYILLTEADADRREAAMWLLGAVMGYWLR